MNKAFTKEPEGTADDDGDVGLPPLPAGGKNYMTPAGYRRLREELLTLIDVERPKVVEIFSWAASNGDRSENGDYLYGKKRLREIDRRLRFLGKRLNAAEVVETSTDRGTTVFFGATVVVAWPDGTEKTFDLVGEDEIEAELGGISWRSPLGQALIRKKEGDTFRFQHGDKVELEVVEVRYGAQTPDPPSRWDRHQAELRQRRRDGLPAGHYGGGWSLVREIADAVVLLGAANVECLARHELLRCL